MQTGKSEKSKKELEQEQIEVAKKKAKELKEAARRLFSTKDGNLIAKEMLRVSGMYGLDNDLLPDERLRAVAGRSFAYKYFIVGMCTTEQRLAIEAPEEGENV